MFDIDWPNVIAFTIYGAVMGGWLYYRGMMDERKKHELEYKWACQVEGCTFEIASNSADMTLRFADNHEAAGNHNSDDDEFD